MSAPLAARSRLRRSAVLGALIAAAALAGSCRTPTDITLEVTTDIPCADLGSTAITVGHLGDIETNPPTTTTTDCNPDGRIGTLVILPSGDDDESVALKVVSGSGRRAEQCQPPDYKGCAVARRALHFLPNRELKIRVSMERDCVDVPCSENETCFRSQCVAATIPDPARCEGAGCGGEVLPASAVGGAEAGQPDASPGDATSADVATPDVVTTDTTLTDTSVTDTGLSDTNTSDTGGGCSNGAVSCNGRVPTVCASNQFVVAGDAAPCKVACSAGACVNVRWIGAGAKHTCAVLTDQTVRCWGDNGVHQLGPSTAAFAPTPVPVPGVTGHLVMLGGDTTCNLRANGAIECWGANNAGQLGSAPNDAGSATPFIVPGVVTGPTDGGLPPLPLAVGAQHACAIGADAGVVCWGRNVEGQLGTGSLSPLSAPVPIGLAAEHITAGGAHSCAVQPGSSGLKCWGQNDAGQLGLATTGAPVATPASPQGNNPHVVFAGAEHTCGVFGNYLPKCWGRNAEGEVGNGSAGAAQNKPANVLGAILFAWWFALGDRHTCTMQVSGNLGEVDCWGDNTSGQLGLDGGPSRQTFQKVPLPGSGLAQMIATGGSHTCIVLTDGQAACWGENDRGQVGDGTSGNNRVVPTIVSF